MAESYLPALARVLMCGLFMWDGVLQLRDPAGTATYFASLNIPMPSIAVWVSIAIHLLGGLGILIGFKTRWAAYVLAAWCLVTGFAVHLVAARGGPAAEAMDNMIHFYKNLAMAGGLLYVAAFGAGALSVDAAMQRPK